MKIQSHSLSKFIEDFRLAGSIGETICFQAIIVYTTLHRQVQLPSEVHIVRHEASSVEWIYLLDPDVVKHDIPHIIENVPDMQYRSREYLYMRGTSAQDGNYILSIHPVSVKCNPATLQELYAKAYN